MATLGGPERVLEAERTTPPDLIVVDQMMPGPEGAEMATGLHSDPATRSTPLALLTGGGGLVAKPFDTECLADRVEAALPIGP